MKPLNYIPPLDIAHNMMKSGQHGGNIRQMAEKFALEPQEIVDFSANINPLGMPPMLRQAIIDHLDVAHHYPDIDYVNLHQSIASAVRCRPEQILAGNGATELIFQWVKYLQPQTALLLEPSFAEYRRALDGINCDTVTYNLRADTDFQVDEHLLDALHSDLDILVMCSPNNPTGLLIDPRLLYEIILRCDTLDIQVLLDESFLEFLPLAQSAIDWLDRCPNLTVLRSLTKFYAIPGIRLGFIASSNTDMLSDIHQYREPWTINAFAVLAGETIFNDINFADNDYAKQTYQWLLEEQSYLSHQLKNFETLKVWPPCVNYLFFRTLDSEIDLQSRLMERGILIRSCANYPGLDHRYYRVAIKSHQDNQRLVDTLKQVL